MVVSILLVFAVCIDAFAVSISYGIGKIKIPIMSALIVSFVGTAFLAVSVFFARIISGYIDSRLCVILSAILLIILGVTNIFQNSIKAYLRKYNGRKKLKFCVFNISFVVSVILDETKADADNSKVLSVKEALALSVALSLDSLATGFSAGLAVTYFIETVVLTFIVGFLCVMSGCIIGRRISSKTKLDLSWITGIVLICIALLNILE